ncbi:MAG: GntR family transcriptional regulator [Gemmatimonadales bacterium]|jgi:DNA-binding transcriptional regulator YhcF (GntR family)
MAETRELILETLRGRVLRGLQAGTLAGGERLPTSREVGAEFGADYRLVIAAYKQLELEGLVELRPRGGVYVARQPSGRQGVPPLPESWLVDVLTEGLSRELPAPELPEWLRRSVETLRFRAAVVTTTVDQAFGLCRELRDDFGIEAESVLADELRGASSVPLPVRRADLIVTTEAHAGWLSALGDELKKPVIAIEVRPELLGGEWALLLRRPVYAVVATAEFGQMLRNFFATVPGIENLRVIVYGRDDLRDIPEDAPTYVTQRVRAQLAGVRIPGRILPATRTISTESARAIFSFIVHSNIEALARSRA